MLKWWIRIAAAACVGVLALLLGLAAFVWIKKRQYRALQDTRDLFAQVDRLAEKYAAKRPNSGLVIAIVQRGRTAVRGYGQTQHGTPPDASTLFEIGSITKVFTALLLALRADAGHVQLDDPIDKFLDSSKVPEWLKSTPITLKQLATHSSGLPRLPAGMTGSRKDEDDPYADYGEEELLADLQKARLKSQPGTRINYSNFGAGLLGYLLARQAGLSYEELLKREVLDPLGMTNTTVTVSPEQQKRLVPAFAKNGKRIKHWNLNVLAGAGGLKSSAGDMVRFIEANLSTNETGLPKSLRDIQRKHHSDRGESIGLGWHFTSLLEGPEIAWHNGGTGGFVSFVAIDRANQTGVFLCANSGDAMAGNADLDDLALEVVKLASKVSLE